MTFWLFLELGWGLNWCLYLRLRPKFSPANCSWPLFCHFLDLQGFPALTWRKRNNCSVEKHKGSEEHPSQNSVMPALLHLLTWLSWLECSCWALWLLSLHFQKSPGLSTAVGESINCNHIRTGLWLKPAMTQLSDDTLSFVTKAPSLMSGNNGGGFIYE